MYNICMGHSSFVGGEQANMRSNLMCVIARPPNVQVSCLCHLRIVKEWLSEGELASKDTSDFNTMPVIGLPNLSQN